MYLAYSDTCGPNSDPHNGAVYAMELSSGKFTDITPDVNDGHYGGYGGINVTRRVRITDKTYITDDMGQHLSDDDYSKKVTTYYNCKNMNLFEYGATTRISYSIANMLNLGVYCNYRLSPVCKDTDNLIHPSGECYISPSPWSVGIEIEIAP